RLRDPGRPRDRPGAARAAPAGAGQRRHRAGRLHSHRRGVRLAGRPPERLLGGGRGRDPGRRVPSDAGTRDTARGGLSRCTLRATGKDAMTRVQATDLAAYAGRVLRAAGYRPEDADDQAGLLLDASLRGIDSHGVATLLPGLVAA